MADDFEKIRRRLRLAVVGMALGMFLAVLSQTVVATAMPAIIVELGGFGRYAWVATAYLVAATVTMPIAGRIADIYGCKRVLLAGIGLFTVASIPAGMSQTLNELVAYRALQGIGGGVVMIGSLVGMAQLFPPQRRARYQALVAMVYALASVLGPALGGFITDGVGWSWVFLMNVPLGAIVLAVVVRTLPNLQAGTDVSRPDYIGMVLLVLAVTPLMFALSSGGVLFDWLSWQIVACLAFGAVMTAVLITVETRTESPILTVDIYRSRGVPVSLAASVLTGFGFYAALLFVPLLLFSASGMSASAAGSHLTPMLLGMVVGAVVMGRRLSRGKGTHRTSALTSTGLAIVGLFLMSNVGEGASILATDGTIVLVGLGLGGMLATFGSAVQGAVPEHMLGAATSSLSFYRSVGGMVGVAAAGAVLTNRLRDGLSDVLSSGTSSTGASVQLPPNWLGSVQLDPRSVSDGQSTAAVVAELERSGLDRPVAEALAEAFPSALTGAIGEVFLVTAAVVVLAFGLSLFLRSENDEETG
ncbi:MAG: MFS transporter [Gammaproteobacteria bacterium]|nr:MFS transporter [Gammaproteobacteria bacterium]